MRYRIVAAENLEELENEVQSYLKMGWVLQAGVSIGQHRAGHLIYAQAMTYLPDESY